MFLLCLTPAIMNSVENSYVWYRVEVFLLWNLLEGFSLMLVLLLWWRRILNFRKHVRLSFTSFSGLNWDSEYLLKPGVCLEKEHVCRQQRLQVYLPTEALRVEEAHIWSRFSAVNANIYLHDCHCQGLSLSLMPLWDHCVCEA